MGSTKYIFNKILLSIIMFTFLITPITASSVSLISSEANTIGDLSIDSSIDPYLDNFYRTQDMIFPPEDVMQAYREKLESGEISIIPQNKIASEKIQRSLRELLLDEKTTSTDPDVIYLKNNWQRLFQENPGLNETLENALKTNTFASTIVQNVWGTAPLVGQYHIPVFLVDFSDNLHDDINHPPSIYYDQYNSPNYLDDLDINAISVKDYIAHESYGMLDVTFDIYGWKTLPKLYSQYLIDNNFIYLDKDTLTAFDPEIDFSQYDHDNDGRIDGFVVIFAGTCGLSNTLPCATIINKVYENIFVDGKKIGDGVIIGEEYPYASCQNLIAQGYNYPPDCRISTLVCTHEFMHVLGMYDLYQVYPYSTYGIPNLSMMTQYIARPMKPINLGAWPSFFLGWAQGITVLDQEVVDINSIDSSPITYIVQDPDKMDSNEFFMVSNRYIGGNSLDRDMFGWNSGWNYSSDNIYGGLEIYHIDENYIFWNAKNLMYDPDGNYYDDTGGHSGIVFEQNKYDAYTSPFTYADFYSYVPSKPENETFDYVPKYYNYATRDLTSKSYNGLQDTNVMVSAQSVSGPVITTYLQSTAPDPIIMELVSPISSSQYSLSDPISFIVWVDQSTIFAPEPTCVWTYYTTTISTDCNFTNTPQALNLPVGNVTLTLTVKDEYSNQTATDQVTIEILQPWLQVEIISPNDGEIYPRNQTVNFLENHIYDTGYVTCKWYLDDSTTPFSTLCVFQNTPEYLNMSVGPHTIYLHIKDSFQEASDSVNIIVDYGVGIDPQGFLTAFISSPVTGSVFEPNDLIYFQAGYINNVGNISCKWYSDNQTNPISEKCEFTGTPLQLGLSSKTAKTRTITLKIKDLMTLMQSTSTSTITVNGLSVKPSQTQAIISPSIPITPRPSPLPQPVPVVIKDNNKLKLIQSNTNTSIVSKQENIMKR